MEVKTVVCPHCGANTTNTVNCDYCGSLFVRFADNGIDISNTSYLSDNIAFPELISEFKENLRLQKQTSELVLTRIIITKLLAGEKKWQNIDVVKSGRLRWSDGDVVEIGNLSGGVCISLGFCDDSFARKYNIIDQHRKFKQLASYSLFEHRTFSGVDEYGPYINDSYAIDFGKDAEGAAVLVSEILEKVYDVKPSDEYGIFTGIGDEPLVRADHWVGIINQTDGENQQMGNQPTAPQQNYPANENQSDDDFWSTTFPMTLVWIMLAIFGIIFLMLFITH